VRTQLGAILLAVEAAWTVLRDQRTPGTPPGDIDDPDEDNTFDLPEGRPIRRKVKQFAKRQLKKMLGTIPTIGAPLPDHFPSLADWTNPMASAMTPLISAYWDEAGKTTRARIGLDPGAWEVHDPHLHAMVSKASLSFCRATNETTDLELGEALDRLKAELLAGLVDRGDTIPELTARVKSVFGRLSDSRAERIGRTEAARAVHAASLESAKESGVVQGKKWLLSANSCPKCQDLAHTVNSMFPQGIPLGLDFAHEGNNPAYANIPHPPLHPHCRCSLVFVLDEEYETLLKQYGPPEPESFIPGAFGPTPAPGRKELPAEPLRPRAATFAGQVLATGPDIPAEGRIGSRAWIHFVHAAHQAFEGNPRLTLAEFKDLLLQNREFLELVHADLTNVLSRKDVEAAATEYRVGDRVLTSYHFVRLR
jgi:hypothetical protein